MAKGSSHPPGSAISKAHFLLMEGVLYDQYRSLQEDLLIIKKQKTWVYVSIYGCFLLILGLHFIFYDQLLLNFTAAYQL